MVKVCTWQIHELMALEVRLVSGSNVVCDTVLGHKSEQNPHCTLPETPSDLCPMTVPGLTLVKGIAFASREVVVAGGAYNSPQLLKLSGVGPTAELSQFGIPTVIDLPGVGGNLQGESAITY